MELCKEVIKRYMLEDVVDALKYMMQCDTKVIRWVTKVDTYEDVVVHRKDAVI